MSKMFEFLKNSPVDQLGNVGGNIALLFNKIRQGEISGKDEIADLVYSRDVSEVAVYDLMKKLENQLINALIVRPKIQSTYQAVYAELNKINAVASFLYHSSRKQQAAYLAEKALKKSMLYEVTNITLNLSNICKGYFAITGNEKKYQYYYELSGELLEQFTAEKTAEDLHLQLFFSQSKKKNNTEKDFHLAEEVFTQLSELKKIHDCNRILVIWGICGVVYCQMKNDLEEGIRICKKCLNHLIPQADRIFSSYIFTFLFHMVPPLIRQGEFIQALNYLYRCEVSIKEHTFNSILVKQYQFIASMHASDIEKADLVIQRLQPLKMNTLQYELFEIHRAYLNLLTNKSMRIARFFNQVPTYSKDKEGMNINILIVQLLYFIREAKHYDFCDRSPGIQRYLLRYLKGTGNRRSTYFIQSLLELESIGFDRNKIDKIKSIKKLEQYSYQESPQDFDIEIVPYEKLWHRVIEWL